MSDPRLKDWMPQPGLLAKNERDGLSETEQRTLGRNRLGFYELYCGNCRTLHAVHRHELPDDGEIWCCSNCRAPA